MEGFVDKDTDEFFGYCVSKYVINKNDLLYPVCQEREIECQIIPQMDLQGSVVVPN